MSWTPIFNIDTSNLSESEKQQALDDREFRQDLLSNLTLINNNLLLLNARFEEAFQTDINENDV